MKIMTYLKIFIIYFILINILKYSLDLSQKTYIIMYAPLCILALVFMASRTNKTKKE